MFFDVTGLGRRSRHARARLLLAAACTITGLAAAGILIWQLRPSLPPVPAIDDSAPAGVEVHDRADVLRLPESMSYRLLSWDARATTPEWFHHGGSIAAAHVEICNGGAGTARAGADDFHLRMRDHIWVNALGDRDRQLVSDHGGGVPGQVTSADPLLERSAALAPGGCVVGWVLFRYPGIADSVIVDDRMAWSVRADD